MKNFISTNQKSNNNSIHYVTHSFPDSVELKIYTIYKKLIATFGCNYMFIMYEDSHYLQRVGFQSNPDWREQFIGKNLIEHCQFRIEFQRRFTNPNVKRVIIPWYTVTPQNTDQRRVIVERREFNIDNGISFCHKLGGIRETIAFAAELNHRDFARSLLWNMNIINQTILELRKISLAHLQHTRLLSNSFISSHHK